LTIAVHRVLFLHPMVFGFGRTVPAIGAVRRFASFQAPGRSGTVRTKTLPL
jgi:hypothetical protein